MVMYLNSDYMNVALDITTIRYRFNLLCADFGICPFDKDCYFLTEDGKDLLTEDGKDLLTMV